jgi:hypothetical protein
MMKIVKIQFGKDAANPYHFNMLKLTLCAPLRGRSGQLLNLSSLALYAPQSRAIPGFLRCRRGDSTGK